MYVLVCFVLFFILQKRELKRFFQEQKAVKKEQQVSDVLNSQSDAIVVIPADEQRTEEADKETGHRGGGLLKFLFSNSKSVRLFGFNLAGAVTPTEKDDVASSMLRLPRFIPLGRNVSGDRAEATMNASPGPSAAGLQPSPSQSSSLYSLEDILRRRESGGRRRNKVESYLMRGANFSESDVDGEDQGGDRTIIVKRIDLIFNETEC